jgi:flagellar motility protein MotE (MotC chaperone)
MSQPRYRASKRSSRTRNGALFVVASCFLASAGIRIGVSGPAIAMELDARQDLAVESPDRERPISADHTSFAELDTLLAAIRERQTALDGEEIRINEKLEILEQAEAAFESKRHELQETERRLAATLAQTDGAVLRDIEQLTSMYENMKPKNAAGIFETMDPRFAAGFLIRMNPQAAADILSGMSAEAAYEASVIMANRNIATMAN